MKQIQRDYRLSSIINEVFSRLTLHGELNMFIIGMGGIGDFLMEVIYVDTSTLSFFNLPILHEELKRKKSTSYVVAIKFSIIDSNPLSEIADGFGVFLFTQSGDKDSAIFRIDKTTNYLIITEVDNSGYIDLGVFENLFDAGDKNNISAEVVYHASYHSIINLIISDFIPDQNITYQ